MKKKQRKYRLLIKVILCTTYFIVMFILGLSAFKIYKEQQHVTPWEDVNTTEEYSKLEITEMSERFATIEDKQIHFAIERKKNGIWKTVLIAIKEKDYHSFKEIIDYTYQRTTTKPKSKKVYGYARSMNRSLKKLAIENIHNFLPFDNEVKLNDKNFEDYLSNVYFDSTIKKQEKPNYIITILVVMEVILMVLLIFTLLDKDKLVDEVDHLLE